ncbi:hypothetical protein FRC04_010287 [Tulasnella sp. 424]|nr:hypothetical protein FRC04_010287 [Tulasnella sp. 424]
MIHFTSWTRSFRREESNPSTTPISKVPFSLFKGITLRRRNKQNDEASTSVKAKNKRINPPNGPGARLFSLFSQSPRGSSGNPPPPPPKDSKPTSRPFSSTNEVAEYRNSPVNLGSRGTPDLNFSDQHHHAGQRDLPQGQQPHSESKPTIARQILSSAQPFRNVEPLITYDNRARATIVHRRQNARTISRTDIVLACAKGSIPTKTTSIRMHSLAEDAKNDTSVKGSVLLSQSERLQSAEHLPSQKPTLKTDDWSTNPKLFPVHHPVIALRVHDRAIPISGAAEQGPITSELQPQNDDTPRLETGPSVVSFVAWRSRFSSSTSSDSEEEASESHQPVAANQGDEELASSRFGIPGDAGVEATGAQRSISHRPNSSIATSTESDRTVRPRLPMNPATSPQTLRRVRPSPQRAPPPSLSSKHKEVERKESQRVQPSSHDSSGSGAERAEGQALLNPRYSAHYRSPGVVVDVSSGRPFDVAETEGQLRFYAMVGSRQFYRATAMSAPSSDPIIPYDAPQSRTTQAC